VTCYERALGLFRDVGDRYHETVVLTSLGDARHAAGDHQAARHAWQQALTILEDLRHPDTDKVRTKLATSW
jgi:predicted negative regulator of RcsB-dependent stress response